MSSGDIDSSVASKYQFVVVAIVACGVFAAGVITIMYRRRRQQQYLERMGISSFPGNTRLLLSQDGVIIEVPTRRTNVAGTGVTTGAQARPKRRRLGPEPKLWDVEIADCADSDDDDDDDDGECDSVESDDVRKEKSPHPVDTDDWQPVSIVLPPHKSSNLDAGTATPPPAPHADISLLIAMPDPSLSAPPDDGTLPLLHVPSKLCPRDADDFESGEYAFPALQLGRTRLDVLDADWADLDAMKPPKPPRQPKQSRQRRPAERTRVDGFTRSLFRGRVA